MKDNIEIIRAACVKANPEKDWKELVTVAYHGHGHSESDYMDVPIRLADVLLAMDKPVKYYTATPTIHNDVCKVLSLWNLRNDDLSAQSKECLAFLAGLLKKTVDK